MLGNENLRKAKQEKKDQREQQKITKGFHHHMSKAGKDSD
jgi:hypothetical protein